jgi:hypothetical protein
MTNLVLDLHDYYNGLYGSGYTPDQEGGSPRDATHNQNFLDYHGTEDALVQNLASAVDARASSGSRSSSGNGARRPPTRACSTSSTICCRS